MVVNAQRRVAHAPSPSPPTTPPRHLRPPCALNRPRRTASPLRPATPERTFMSCHRLTSTGHRGPDSRLAQLLYSHSRGAEVRVLREPVHRKAQREPGPGLTRAVMVRPNLRCRHKGQPRQPSFHFSLIVELVAERACVLEDEKPLHISNVLHSAGGYLSMERI